MCHNKNHHFQKLGWVFFFVLVTILISPLGIYITNSTSAIKVFLLHRGSYTQIRLSDPIAMAAIEARSIIPSDAPIDFSPSRWVWERVRARYYLYPLKNIDFNNWLYFIDFDHSKETEFAGLNNVTLSNGIRVYSRHEAPPLSSSREGQVLPRNSTKRAILVFSLVQMFNLLLGTALLLILKIPITHSGFFWWLSTAYLIGFLFLTGILWIFMLLGGSLNWSNLILLWSVCLVIPLLWALIKRNQWIYLVQNWRINAVRRMSPPSFVLRSIILLTSLIILLVFLSTVLTPVQSWDAMSHWIYKSKAFSHTEQLDFSGQGHNQYPILWSLNIAAQFTLQGQTDSDELAKWTAGLFILIFIAQYFGAIRFMGISRNWGWIILFLFSIGTSLLKNHSLSAFLSTAYAEAAFLSFLSATIAVGVGAISIPKNRKIYMIMAVLLSLGLNGLKLEGLPASVIIGFSLCLVIFLSTRKWRTWMWLGLFLMPGVLQNIGWNAWLVSAGFPATSGHEGALILKEILPKIVPLVNAFQKTSQFYGILVGAAFGVLLINIREPWKEVDQFLAMVTIGLLLFSMVGLLGWPKEEIISHSHTAMGRLYFHAAPSIALFIACRGFRDIEVP